MNVSPPSKADASRSSSERGDPKALHAGTGAPIGPPSQCNTDFGPADTKRRTGIAILFVTAFIAGIGQTLLFSILPPIARDLQLSELQVGWVFSVSAVFWVLMGPVWGRRSDRVGRKPVALIGIAAYVISMILLGTVLQLGVFGVVSGFWLFLSMLLARTVYGAFGCAGPTASQAYIADRTKPIERAGAMAGFAAAFGLGSTIGPGLGAVGALFGPVVPIYLTAVLGALGFGLVAIFLTERRPPQDRAPRPRLALTDRRLGPILIYGTFTGMLNALLLQVITFYLIDRLVLSTEEALAASAPALMAMSGAALFAPLVLIRRFNLSPRRVMVVAPWCVALGYLIVILSGSLWSIVIGVTLVGLGNGALFPSYNAAASLSVTKAEQGVAAGLAGSAGASGFIVAPSIAFTLYELSPQAPFWLAIAIALGLAAYAALFLRHRIPSPETSPA